MNHGVQHGAGYERMGGRAIPTHRRTIALHRLIGSEQPKRVGIAGREELAFAADGLDRTERRAQRYFIGDGRRVEKDSVVQKERLEEEERMDGRALFRWVGSRWLLEHGAARIARREFARWDGRSRGV